MVADDDLALGMIVEAVWHSKFWPETAIFVLEDDAQNGPGSRRRAPHAGARDQPVDQTPAASIPRSTRRPACSARWSSSSASSPMCASSTPAARPMWASFSEQADLTPFKARPAQVNLDERNSKLAWGERIPQRMDFSGPDEADDIKLNEIVWRSVAARVPDARPRRAAFYKAHAKDDDDEK